MKKLDLFLGLALIIGIFIAGCVGSSRGNERKCGAVSYDPMEQVYCGDTLHTSTRTADWFCCGEDYVDIDSATIECCGSTAIHKADQHCCNGQVAPGAEPDT